MATHTIERRTAVRPLRMVLGVFPVLHGIAHFVGTAGSLSAMTTGPR